MSDDFIPFSQSTPIRGGRQSQDRYLKPYYNNWQSNNHRSFSGHNQRRSFHSQRNSSFGSDSNNSFNQEHTIDAYLHPSMLQNPWAQLEKKMLSKTQNIDKGCSNNS